jgi:uncharacterized protein (TIGR02246 family)
VRKYILSICLILASTIGLAAQENENIERDQLKTIQAFEAAWEKGDIETMLSLCTKDSEYINASGGFYWRTPEELRKGWAFERTFGAIPRPEVRTFRQLNAETGIVVTRYLIDFAEGKRPPGAPPVIKGMIAAVLVKQNGKWLISYGQSTAVNPQAPAPR